MNWLKRLFGNGGSAGRESGSGTPSQKAGESLRAAPSRIHLEDNFLRIDTPELEFFGIAGKSANGRWIVGCSESSGSDRGGSRGASNGRVVLVDSSAQKVVLQLAAVQRPNNPHVADTGVFSLEDWRFGNNLDGEFLVYSATGKKLFQRKFAANIYSSALSPCGRYACVQTANNPASSDGSLLELYDISAERTLFSTHPSEGWSNTYKFKVGPAGLEKLYVSLDDVGDFAYSPAGVFLDKALLEAARLENGAYSTMILAAERLLKADLTEAAASRALAAANKALAKGASKDSGWAAHACRVAGAAHEQLGETDEALTAYGRALSLNPKIGVKRRIEVLRKRQPTNREASS